MISCFEPDFHVFAIAKTWISIAAMEDVSYKREGIREHPIILPVRSDVIDTSTGKALAEQWVSKKHSLAGSAT